MKTIKKIFTVLAAAALASCVPEANEAPRIAATQINIFEVGASGAPVTITALVPLQIGDVRTLSAEVLPADATDKAVTWSSSDDSIVAIDATGKLTAKASGNATITASAGGAAATLAVSVAYSVTTETELRAMANNLAGYYVLKNDISLANEWTPLETFTGTLDGAGYSVTNLWINQTSLLPVHVGFTKENQGTIKNIGVEIGSQGITGGGNILGALVGLNRGYVSGRVTGVGKIKPPGDFTGGLVGNNLGGTVIGYSTVDVESEGSGGTGGLVGQSTGGLVIGYATGAVSGVLSVGGLVGIVAGGTVVGYARGAVTGTHSDSQQNVNRIGGLIGTINSGSIYGYARGAVSTDREGFADGQKQTLVGPAVGSGDATSAANIYYSGKSGESTFTYKGSSGTVTPNTLGNQVSVTTSTAQSAFPNLTFGTDVGEWTFYTGKWPAINFPADTIFDDVRGDKQDIDP